MSAVLALLASLVWGTSDFVGGLTARRIAVRALIGCSQLVGVATLLVVVAAFGLWQLDARSLGWGLGSGAVGVLALAAFYRGLAIGPMSIVSPVASVGVLVPFAVGLGQGERPAALQLLGAAFAIAGVAVAARPAGRAPSSGRHLQAVGLGLVSAVGFGLVLTGVHEGSESSIAMTLLWMRLLGVGGLGLLTLATMRTRLRISSWPRWRDLPALVVVGDFDLGANALYAVATSGRQLAVVAVLASLYPAVTAVLAWRVGRERLGRVQTAGVAGALAGVVLLAAG